jgi:hypothetical protein
MDYLLAIGIYCVASPIVITLLALAAAQNRDRAAHRQDTAITRELLNGATPAAGTAA